MIFWQVKDFRLDCLMLEKDSWKGHQKSRWFWRSFLGRLVGLGDWNRCVELLVALNDHNGAYGRHRLLEGAVGDGVEPASLL